MKFINFINKLCFLSNCCSSKPEEPDKYKSFLKENNDFSDISDSSSDIEI